MEYNKIESCTFDAIIIGCCIVIREGYNAICGQEMYSE